jgi:hypothetical protein
MDDFSKQKAIYKTIGSLIRFAYDDTGSFGLNSTCIIVSKHAKFIAAYFNSLVGNYLLSKSTKTGTGDLRIECQAVKPILVPKNAESLCLLTINKIIEKVNTNVPFDKEEAEFDNTLFAYFGFTEIEQNFIRRESEIYR